MKYVAMIGLAVLLAGCGADGLPTRPGLNLGLSIGPNGIRPTVQMTSQVGPVAVSVGN